MELTIDQPATGWDGQVGFVTEPLARLHLDTGRSTAFVCGPEPMIRFSAQVLLRRGVPATDIRVSLERDMKCAVGLCGHCQFGPILICRDGPVVGYPLAGPLCRPGVVMMVKPSLAVWKLASCDGCQLALLDCEDELLALAGAVTIAHFLEASSAVRPGPYDLSLVEGSVTTAATSEQIREIRARLTDAGHYRRVRDGRRIQALRNFGDVPSSPRRSTPARSISRRWPPRPRSRRTCRSTSSCAAARSTGGSCWKC